MERLTEKLMGGYVLPTIPMEIKSKEDLDKFTKVRRFYEDCLIRCGEYEDLGMTPEEINIEIRESAELIAQLKEAADSKVCDGVPGAKQKTYEYDLDILYRGQGTFKEFAAQISEYIAATGELVSIQFEKERGRTVSALVMTRKKVEKSGCWLCESEALDNVGYTKVLWHANVYLPGGNSTVPEEERFKFCPCCGKERKA